MKKLTVYVPMTAQDLQEGEFSDSICIISLKEIEEIRSVELSNLVQYKENIVFCDVRPKIMNVFRILHLDRAFDIMNDLTCAVVEHCKTETNLVKLG